MEYIEDFFTLPEFELYAFKFKDISERFNLKNNKVENSLKSYKIGLRIKNSLYFLNSFLLEKSLKKDRGIRELISKNILNNFGAVLYLDNEDISKEFEKKYGTPNFLKNYFLLGYVWSIKDTDDKKFIKNIEYAVDYNSFISSYKKDDNYIYNIYHKNIYDKIVSNLRYKLT